VALEEVELYTDPHQQQGRRSEYDLADPAVQQHYLKEIDEDKFNVEWIACPCTTFCDWNLQNGGTRTFSQPLGRPTPKEDNGNVLSTFGATAFERALDRGHFPIAESSGISGRYPKQWHLPCWQRILRRPDVQFIEIDMCSFGLGPADYADGRHFYRHRTGLAFPRHPGVAAALLRLCPGLSHQHQHVPLKGSRDGANVTRCTEAGVYAPAFVEAVVRALQSLLEVGGGLVSPHRLRAGGVVQSRGEGESDIGDDDAGSSYSSSTSEMSCSRDGDQQNSDGRNAEGVESERSESDVEIEVEVEVQEDEEPELAVDEIGGDFWWKDEINGLLWIEHRVPRRTMIQPGGPGCPFRGDEFEDGRWTKVIPADTMDTRDAWEILDNWRTEGNCDAPILCWCGTTVFAFKGHEIGRDPPWDAAGRDDGDADQFEDHTDGDGEGPEEDHGDGDGQGDGDGATPDAQDEGDCGVCGADGQDGRGHKVGIG